MIRSRLYIKMYLTVLCGLLLVAMSLGTFAMLADDEDHGFSGKLDRFASALLSSEMTTQQRQDMLERLAHGLNADVAIFDKDDKYVQGAGALSTSAAADAYLADGGHRHKREFEATLPNGGHVRVFIDSHFSEAKGKFVPFVVIVAIAIGIALISQNPPLALFALFCVYGLSGYAVYAWRRFRGKPASVIAISTDEPEEKGLHP